MHSLSALRALALSGCAFLLTVSVAQAQAIEWQGATALISGSNNSCSRGGPMWVTEGNSKLILHIGKGESNKGTAWPQSADGSVKADVKGTFPFTRLYRVEAPAGKGPREILVTDLEQACRYKLTGK